MTIEARTYKTKQTIQIDLPNGLRDVQERTVRDITANGTRLIGKTTLFERPYTVVWMDRLGQWRPCDSAGNYLRIVFTEGMQQYEKTRQRRQQRQQETAVASA